MAKKKKGNKSKQKSPLPQIEGDGAITTTGNISNNKDQQREEQSLDVPKSISILKEDETGSRDATDQESEDYEKQSEEQVEEVPNDKEQSDEQLDQEVEIEESRSSEEAPEYHNGSKDYNDVDDSVGDHTEVTEIQIDSNNNNEHTTQENGTTNVHIEKATDTEENGRDPKDQKSEDVLKATQNETTIDMDQKPEADFLEHTGSSTNLRRPSIAALKELTPEGSVINEWKSEQQLETKDELPDPPKPQATKLVNSSTGPYSIHDLINELPLHNPDIKDSENAYPTYVEKLNDHIYIGTSHGEILHFFKIDSDFILVSRNSFHQTRIRPITKILLLPKIEKALVLAGGLLSCFLLPEFSPANIGRVKEVNDISLDFDNKAKNDSNGVHVAVYTTNQIRIINVTPSALRLVKDITYSDSKKGLRRSEYSLVASRDNYDLIDLQNFQKIPLFPILTVQDQTGNQREPLSPFILPVGKEEFLVTCGISKEEPSMGLVLNLNGDISRGTIPLSKYPDSIGINYPYVVSTFGKNIAVNSLHDQLEVQSLEFTGDVQIGNVSSEFTEPYNDLVDLIKLVPIVGENKEREVKEFEFVSKISTISTSLVCFCSNFVKILLPQPRLIRLVDFQNIEQLEDELKSVDGSTELGVIEIEYINLLIGLTHLKNKSYTQSFETWTNGTVDPRILIYIFKYSVYGEVWLFNGLKPLVEELRKSIKETKFRKFFSLFLEKWIKKETFTENTDIVKSIELANLKESLDDNSKVLDIVDKDIKLTLDETLSILKENGKHTALAKIYTKQGKYRDVLQLYKDLEDGNKTDPSFNKDDGLTIIIDLVYKHFSQDEDLVWEIGLWLMNKRPELGLNFFQNEGLNIKIKDETLLISKIDDISLKYKYIEKLLVRLNKDKMRTNLVKNLYKTELKGLNERIRIYRNHTNQ